MEHYPAEEQHARALEFDEIAETIFSPVYPVLAEQIAAATGITYGSALDIGSGGGHLGLNLLKVSQLEMTLLDSSMPAVGIAARRAEAWGLSDRVRCLHGDVHAIALADASMDLCISRGSLWFWKETELAFSEILRVLRPGGQAYLGSGFATGELGQQINARMRQRDATWPARRSKFTEGHTPERYARLLASLPLSAWQIIDDERGFWLHFTKGVSQ